MNTVTVYLDRRTTANKQQIDGISYSFMSYCKLTETKNAVFTVHLDRRTTVNEQKKTQYVLPFSVIYAVSSSAWFSAALHSTCNHSMFLSVGYAYECHPPSL